MGMGSTLSRSPEHCVEFSKGKVRKAVHREMEGVRFVEGWMVYTLHSEQEV